MCLVTVLSKNKKKEITDKMKPREDVVVWKIVVDFSKFSAKQFKTIVQYCSTLVKMGAPQDKDIIEGLRVEWERREEEKEKRQAEKREKFSQGRQEFRTEQREQRIRRRTS